MAETLNINRSLVAEQGDGADRAALPDHTATRRRPERGRARLNAEGWLTVLILAVLVLGGLGAFLYQQWLILDLEYPLLTTAVRVLLLVGIPTIATLGLGSWLYARGQQARIVRLENDHPVAIEAALSGAYTETQAATLAAFYQTQTVWAANSGLRSLNQLDLSNTKAADVKSVEPAQLAAPLGFTPAAEWLSWIDQTPHLMIAGRTNAGKTTLATAVLAQRVRAGELLAVLDPHDQPGKWFGAQAIGGGRDYDAILAALAGLLAEMDRRYEAYNQGRTDFPRLTALIDEVPAIVLRGGSRWEQFATQLGSEARKVNMSVVLLTQSPLVRDIKISSVMRENFTRIALGDQAPELLSEERDQARRRALHELLRGQAHPAAMEYRGEVHLLDTSDVPGLARQSGRARLWTPPACPARISPEDATRKALAALKARGVSREDARRVYRLEFTNSLWGEL